MWDGFNQRRFPRINIQCRLILHSPKIKAPIKGVTQNLGLGGAAVNISQEIERMAPCRIIFDTGSSGSQGLEFEGRIAWSVAIHTPHSRKKIFDVGVEFVNPPDEKISRLHQFLLQTANPQP